MKNYKIRKIVFRIIDVFFSPTLIFFMGLASLVIFFPLGAMLIYLAIPEFVSFLSESPFNWFISYIITVYIIIGLMWHLGYENHIQYLLGVDPYRNVEENFVNFYKYYFDEAREYELEEWRKE